LRDLGGEEAVTHCCEDSLLLRLGKVWCRITPEQRNCNNYINVSISWQSMNCPYQVLPN
jgi:hypothetical protein